MQVRTSKMIEIIGKVLEAKEEFINGKGRLQQYIRVFSISEKRERMLTLFEDKVTKFKEIQPGKEIQFKVYRRDVYTDEKTQRWINVIDLVVYEAKP